MIISNVGTIVASFAVTSSSSGVSAASQVQLLSLSNTLSRLITGPIADFTSPIPIAHPQPTRLGERQFHPKRLVTRVAFVQLSAVLLLVAFGWMTVGVVSAKGVWVMSLLAGAAYGMIWCVPSSLLSSSQHLC